MKKIAALMIAITAGVLSLNAQEPERLTISAGQLKNISFGDRMKVVLVANASQSEVKGDMDALEKLNISVFNGSMNINPGKGLGDNATVYVIVNDLQSLTLGQHTKVENEGILYSSRLKIFVQEGSIARLRTTGVVNAYSLDDLELSITKTPVRLNASVKNAIGF